ncbi:phosphatidylethanolamine-binding protein [Clohesyomyces aquaticus]|uniref:Phosphatidylethanolamine-binding protein n=1 Tax=Clohesyomyces aquaticus TaxID=1231657 RepID=A0A1Y2A9M8_9PLEO|nr:phosphatidylethanolamine-binding protein [Clohesyomyces aquaticus]
MGVYTVLLAAVILQARFTLAHGDAAESVSVSDFKADFISAQIVPDVLAAFNPSVAFYAGFASADGDEALLTPGMALTVAEAAAPIEFSVENISKGTNVTDTSRFIVYMIGPDVPSRATPTSRNVRHYLAGNFTVSSSNSTILATAAKLTNSSTATNEYSAPTPKSGTGVHRYVYLLYTQPKKFDTTDFASVGLNVSNRMNFNLSTFRTQAGLGPAIGGTYFTINIDGANTTSNTTGSTKPGAASMTKVSGALALMPLLGGLLLAFVL